MTRRLPCLGALAFAAAASLSAQCYEPQTGAVIGTGDDIVLPMQSLGFAFPFAGTTWTDVHVTTNGFVHLSNAGVPAHTGALCCQGSTAQLVIGAPKICAYWSDLDLVAGTGTVLFNALPGKTVITWENAVELGDPAQFSVQLTLFASGEITCAYDSRCMVRTGGNFLVGMSEGNGAAVPAASNFVVPGFSPSTTCFELFNTAGLAFDLTGLTLQFLPTNPGYVWAASPCAALHASYGAGCYAAFASFYELFGNPVSLDLLNSAMSMLFTGGGYIMAPGLAAFVPPSAQATTLSLGDDAQATVTLAAPFPHLGGASTQLTICSNGFVSVGAAGNGLGFDPDPAVLLAAANPGFWMLHDYNPTSPGSGQVTFEQQGGVAYVTWSNVHTYGTTVGDTFQFQFGLATGHVSIVWGPLGRAGNGYLVGYSPGGASVDPGSRDLSATLPSTFAVGNFDLLPLALSASPRPIAGGTVTFTTSHVPEFAPASGLFVALHVLSLGLLSPPGIDLGFLGAPGCAVLLPSLDVSLAMVGTSDSLPMVLTFPGSAAIGTMVYSQAIALLLPNSLPNGQNAAGLVTSNGLASRIGAW